MKSIHRYEVEIADSTYPLMPQGAEILNIGVKMMYQRDGHPRADIWAKVDTEAPLVPRHIRIYGTGHPLEEGVEETYIGTIQVAMGALIFHAFDRGEVAPQSNA